MNIAKGRQNFFDWLTQQWVILTGKKIDVHNDAWILSPFGNQHGIGTKFIKELASRENLLIDTEQAHSGLLNSIHDLGLSTADYQRLNTKVVDFYENTAAYHLHLEIHWNPLFKFFGRLLRFFFSNRIDQLNVPISNTASPHEMSSQIIKLVHPTSHKNVRTIWLRTLRKTGQVIYSGIYETCNLPNGEACIKAIFPLPHGNATVILLPSVGDKGELRLTSAGKKFGDSGFYFLLKDGSGVLFSRYIPSFKDELVVFEKDNNLEAIQTLTLWGMRVLTFKYEIQHKDV